MLQATLLSRLVLWLTHLHGGYLTSMPVLPAVAAVPHPGRSLGVVEAVMGPGSAGGPPQGPSRRIHAGPQTHSQPRFPALPYPIFPFFPRSPSLSAPNPPDPLLTSS